MQIVYRVARGWLALPHVGTKASLGPEAIAFLIAALSFFEAHACPASALMFAADLGDERIVQILLDAGTDPSIHSDEGRTAVDFAHWANPQASIDLLEKARRRP